jgi:hypothetical protein
MVLNWILLLFHLFTFGNNYYHYSTIEKLTDTEYDCLYNYMNSDSHKTLFTKPPVFFEQPIEQSVSYCLAVKNVARDNEFCIRNTEKKLSVA